MPALPLHNQLLVELSAAEWRALHAGFEDVQLPAGTALHEAGVVLRHVYFPTTAVISLTSSMRDGALAEIAAVGREGVVGVCAYMGQERSLSSAVVQTAGHAWKLPASVLRQASQDSPALMRALLGYTQALFVQMAQTSACSRHHVLEQQLCRWLLLHLDHTRGGSELAVTQERIGQMLGVRREGVTIAALKLQQAGVIQYRRGHIAVLDRAALELRSCECYGVVRSAYDRLRVSADAAHGCHCAEATPAPCASAARHSRERPAATAAAC